MHCFPSYVSTMLSTVIKRRKSSQEKEEEPSMPHLVPCAASGRLVSSCTSVTTTTPPLATSTPATTPPPPPVITLSSTLPKTTLEAKDLALIAEVRALEDTIIKKVGELGVERAKQKQLELELMRVRKELEIEEKGADAVDDRFLRAHCVGVLQKISSKEPFMAICGFMDNILQPKPSRIFCGHSDRYLMRNILTEHIYQVLGASLSAGSNIIVWTTLDARQMKKNKSDFYRVEMSRVSYAGKLEKTPLSAFYSKEQMDPRNGTKYSSFREMSYPRALRWALCPYLQQRRLLRVIREEEVTWLSERGLRYDHIWHKQEKIACLFLDHVLLHEKKHQVREFLELDPEEFFPAAKYQPKDAVDLTQEDSDEEAATDDDDGTSN